MDNSEDKNSTKNDNNLIVLAQYAVSIAISVGSYFALSLLVQLLDGTCYALPLDYGDIKDARLKFTTLFILLALFWSPLLYRRKYIRYISLTIILLIPSIYYLITVIPYDESFHNGLCF